MKHREAVLWAGSGLFFKLPETQRPRLSQKGTEERPGWPQDPHAPNMFRDFENGGLEASQKN